MQKVSVPRISTLGLLLPIMLWLGCSAPERPEQAASAPTWRSYQKAQAILDAGLQALGGIEKIKALKSIAIAYEGRRHMINQSRTPEGPWDKEPSTGKVIIDR